MADPESIIFDEQDNSVDTAATNLCVTSLGEIPVTQTEPQAQTLPPLESTKKKKVSGLTRTLQETEQGRNI